MNFTDISDCELLVMRCLWEAGEPISVHALIEELDKRFGKKYKETTVYTFLANLRKKGYVTSYKKGASYFSPIVRRDDFIKNYARIQREFWQGETLEDLITAIIFPDGADQEQRSQISELLK